MTDTDPFLSQDLKSSSKLQEGSFDTSEPYNPVTQLSRNLNIGQEQVQANQHAAWMMSQNMDDGKRMDMLRAGVTKVQGGYTQDQQHAEPWYQQLTDNVEQTLPAIGDTLIQGGVGAGAGGAIGAAAGSVIPGAGTLAGASFGASKGWQAGSFKAGWEQSAGQIYMELRKLNVDHEDARNVAIGVGAVNGALNVVGIGALKGIAGKAVTQAEEKVIQAALSHEAVQQISKNMLGRFAMSTVQGTAEQTGVGTAQALTNEAGKAIAGLLQKHNPEAFTDFGTAAGHVKDAFLQSVMTGGALSLGAGIAGAAGGVGKASLAKGFTREQIDSLKGITPEQAIKKLTQHLDEQPNPWEAYQQQPTVEHDEAGNVYIKTGVAKSGQTTMTDIAENPQTVISKGLSAIYPEEKVMKPKEVEAEGSQLRLPIKSERLLHPTEVQGRLNQIAADTRILKKEERRLEGLISAREKSGAAPQVLVNKWHSTTHAIDALEAQKHLLEQGLGTTETEAGQSSKLKVNTLAKVFDNLEETAKRLQKTKEQLAQGQLELPEIGFKKGALDKEREIRKLQTGLMEAVNSITEDPNIRAQVKQYVAGVTTPEKALQAIATIKEKALGLEKSKFEKANEADRAKTFNKVVNMLNGRRVKIQGSHETSPFSPEVTKNLQILRGFLKDEKSINAFMDKVVEVHGNTEVQDLPTDIQHTMRLASMAQTLHDGTAIERNVTAGTIAQWVHDGDKLMAEKRAAFEKERTETREAVQQSVGASKQNLYRTKSTPEKVRSGFNELFATGFTWNNLWDFMSPKDKNKTATKLLDESEARHNYENGVHEATQRLQNHVDGYMKENGFKGNLAQKVWHDNNTLVKFSSMGHDGKMTPTEMTRGEALDVYLKYMDDNTHNSLRKGSNFTLPGDAPKGTSTIEQIESILTKDDKSQLQGLLNFYKEEHKQVNQVFSDRYGAYLPFQDNYSPAPKVGQELALPFSQAGKAVKNLVPSSGKLREDSALPIKFENPMKGAVRYINEWQHFQHYQPLIDRISHVMTDPVFRAHTENNFGYGTLKVLDDFTNRFIKNSPIPSMVGNGWWSAMSGDFSNIVMGFKFNQFLTIFPHGLNTLANYSVPETLAGIHRSILAPAETQKALANSPIFKERTKTGTNFDLEASLHSAGLFGNTIGKIFGIEPTLGDVRAEEAVKRFMYAGHLGADIGIQKTFGAVVYNAELHKGATPEQALIAAERAIEQTQPGRSVSQTPYIQTNPIANALALRFIQHPLQVMGKSITAVNDWANNMHDPKAWMDLGGKMGALWVIPGMLTGAARALPLLAPNQNEDEAHREAAMKILGGGVMGPLEAIPGIAEVMQHIWFTTAKPIFGLNKKEMEFPKSDNYAMKLYHDFVDANKAWEKTGTPSDPTKLVDVTKQETKIAKAQIKTAHVGSTLFGIPEATFGSPLNAAKQAKAGDPLGAAFAGLGYPESTLKERLPKEQKMTAGGPTITDASSENSSTYDTINTYLNSLFQHSEPPKSAEDRHSGAQAFMEQASK